MASRRPPRPEADEDEDATSLDLGARVGVKPGSAARKDNFASPAKALHSNEGNDEDATEFLATRPRSNPSPGARSSSQPELGAPQLRARGRAVPLEGGPSALASVANGAEPPRVPLPRARGGALAGDEPEVTGPPQGPDDDERATTTGASTPRVTKFNVHSGGRPAHRRPRGASETDPAQERPNDLEEDDSDGARVEVAAPPRHRPLPPRADAAPNPFKREVTRAKPTAAHHQQVVPAHQAPTARHDALHTSSAATGEASELADGTLVVEVPDGAVVFVNGAERGRGPLVRVEGVDRYNRIAVRVHASGFLHWSGSVCLDGRTAAKVRPALKKKG